MRNEKDFYRNDIIVFSTSLSFSTRLREVYKRLRKAISKKLNIISETYCYSRQLHLYLAEFTPQNAICCFKKVHG